jgi:hypothetical protein
MCERGIVSVRVLLHAFVCVAAPAAAAAARCCNGGHPAFGESLQTLRAVELLPVVGESLSG